MNRMKTVERRNTERRKKSQRETDSTGTRYRKSEKEKYKNFTKYNKQCHVRERKKKKR